MAVVVAPIAPSVVSSNPRAGVLVPVVVPLQLPVEDPQPVIASGAVPLTVKKSKPAVSLLTRPPSVTPLARVQRTKRALTLFDDYV